MNWPKIFSSQKTLVPARSDFDKKLIKKINHRFWPSWAQMKYIGRFFNATESKVIKASVLLIALSMVVLVALFVIKNNVIVPADGGEYSEALIGQPKFINPLFAPANDVDADISSLVFSGLFRFDANLRLAPDLAQSFTISDDGLTYDIALRDDVKWSDDENFTASDVVYTFEMIQDPEVGSPLFPSFQGINLEQIDDYNIRFTLKEPYAPFINSLTTGILPQHYWSDISPASFKLARHNLQPIGAGPWQFSKLTKDETGNIQTYALTRNENYYGQRPHLKNLVFKFYADQIQAQSALKSQEVAALSFLPEEAKNSVPGKVYNFHSFKLPQYAALFFNSGQNEILKDTGLRDALELAIDKQAILRDVLNGNGETVNSPFLPGVLGYNSDIKYAGYNAQTAATLLDKNWKRVEPEEYYKNLFESAIKSRQEDIEQVKKAASNTPELVSSTIKKIEDDTATVIRESMAADQQYYRKDKNGEPLKITITTADTHEYKNVAEYVAKAWRAVGAQTAVELVSSFELTRNTLKTRGYQVLLYGEIVGSDPDPYPFWHSSQIDYPGLNLAMFTDRNADKLLEEARGLATPQKREELYKKFQEILAKEKPAIFLYAPKYLFAVGKEIKGVIITQIANPQDRFADLASWYVKTRRTWKITK